MIQFSDLSATYSTTNLRAKPYKIMDCAILRHEFSRSKFKKVLTDGTDLGRVVAYFYKSTNASSQNLAIIEVDSLAWS